MPVCVSGRRWWRWRVKPSKVMGMHELSLCRSLIDLLQQQAAVSHFSRVKQLWLEAGPLAAVEPEALKFAFTAARPLYLSCAFIIEEGMAASRCEPGDRVVVS